MCRVLFLLHVYPGEGLPPRAGGGVARTPLRVRPAGPALRRPGPDARRGALGAVAGGTLAVCDCRHAAPAAAGHRRGREPRAARRRVVYALALHRGASPARQHHAGPQGGLPPVLHPAPPAEPSGAPGAAESRGGLRRAAWGVRGGATTMLDLADIQRGVLGPRPSPYAGAYILLRIDDPLAGRAVLKRLTPLIASAADLTSPLGDAWLAVALSYPGIAAVRDHARRRVLLHEIGRASCRERV